MILRGIQQLVSVRDLGRATYLPVGESMVRPSPLGAEPTQVELFLQLSLLFFVGAGFISDVLGAGFQYVPQGNADSATDLVGLGIIRFSAEPALNGRLATAKVTGITP